MEAIGDFPFSDDFGDDTDRKPKPIKNTAVKPDERGYQPPNWARGRASRANCIALMLQPFARHLITGPCPAYHVGKAKAGTGAGLLATVLFQIVQGIGRRSHAPDLHRRNPQEDHKHLRRGTADRVLRQH